MEEHCNTPLKNIGNVMGTMGSCVRKVISKNEDAAILSVNTFPDSTEEKNHTQKLSEMDHLESQQNPLESQKVAHVTLLDTEISDKISLSSMNSGIDSSELTGVQYTKCDVDGGDISLIEVGSSRIQKFVDKNLVTSDVKHTTDTPVACEDKDTQGTKSVDIQHEASQMKLICETSNMRFDASENKFHSPTERLLEKCVKFKSPCTTLSDNASKIIAKEGSIPTTEVLNLPLQAIENCNKDDPVLHDYNITKNVAKNTHVDAKLLKKENLLTHFDSPDNGCCQLIKHTMVEKEENKGKHHTRDTAPNNAENEQTGSVTISSSTCGNLEDNKHVDHSRFKISGQKEHSSLPDILCLQTSENKAIQEKSNGAQKLIASTNAAQNACLVLSTLNSVRNVESSQKEDTRIESNEHFEDKSKTCLISDAEKSIDILESSSVKKLNNSIISNKTANVICVNSQENSEHKSVKTSDNVLNLPKSITLPKIKRPIDSHPALEEKVKRSKPDTSNQKKIIEIDLTKDDPEKKTENAASKAISNNMSEGRNDKKRSNFENFVSNDPKENDDNNNPEWEVLKKLETDDERYKAVRKRWRSLVIPDPNKNLTCIHIKSTFKQPVFCPTERNEQEDVATRNKRKRAITFDPSSSADHVPVKRARTRSCTTSYDIKVQNCYKKVQEEEKKLKQLKNTALAHSHHFYSRQHMTLRASNLQYYNSWEFATRVARLRAQQREAEAAVHREFSGAMDRLQGEKHKKVLVFGKAMKEVEAFHKFYRKLDESSVKHDCFFLTDVELDDVLQTDELYETFQKFYSN